MKSNVYNSRYKDINCLVLENDTLKVTVVPESGGKIQSVYNKDKRKEYIWQSPNEKYRKGIYDTLFEAGEFSGFDDMFPGVSECFYPAGPWKGTRVPDHGEVWSLPWDSSVTGDEISLGIHGVRFPYRLEKRIGFLDERVLRIDYTAINLSDFDFDFIWAAHPLFNCSENMEIIFPPPVKKLITTYSGNGRLGGFGTLNDWPVAEASDGTKVDMSRIAARNPVSCEKYYVYGKMDKGWCALRDRVTSEVIGLSYPADKVPYLGMWLNEGGYHGQYNVAPEPCTGALDAVDTAVKYGQGAVIKAKAGYEWYLNITFDTKEKVGYIDEYGRIQ